MERLGHQPSLGLPVELPSKKEEMSHSPHAKAQGELKGHLYSSLIEPKDTASTPTNRKTASVTNHSIPVIKLNDDDATQLPIPNDTTSSTPSVPAPTSITIPGIAELLALQSLVTSRPAESERFSGDPFTYREWFQRFKNNVHNVNGLSDSKKFEELFFWTKGQAKKAISVFTMEKDSSLAYRSALQKLEETWGKHEKASSERLKKILEGKVIGPKDLSAARDLTWDLQEIVMHAKLNNNTKYLETAEAVLSIVDARIPTVLRHKWNKYSFDLKKAGKESDLEAFITFLISHIELLEHTFSLAQKR